MDPNMMGLPTGGHPMANTGVVNGYRCGSNTSSSSGRGSSIQHASLPRHFSGNNQRPLAGTSELPSPMSEVPIITNGLPSVSAHIPLQHHNLAYNTANKNRPNNYGGAPPPSNYGHNNSYYYQHQRPPPLAPSNGGISGQPNTHQYNSHYRGPPNGTSMHPPRKPLNHGTVQNSQPSVLPHASDYAILKFNTSTNGSVGKEIDV